MTRTSLKNFNCSLAQALDILGDRWTMLIIRDAFYGVSRFSRFQQRLGIARNVLANRLNVLVEAGVLKRVFVRPDNERVAYKLTTQGKELFPTIVALTQWGDRWIAGAGQEPVKILDAENCAPVQPINIISRDGRHLHHETIVFAAGPGASDVTRAGIDAFERSRRMQRADARRSDRRRDLK